MDFDWIVIGSGFGGSTSALRLVEKGYRVLVLEKGRRWAPEDFPKTNWDLRRWMWMPQAGLRGFFQMSFMEHITVLHGVGVGGGSLVYANTLPTPGEGFFQAPSWRHLADWREELEPHYQRARSMLGATPNPVRTRGDEVLAEIARDLGRSEHHHPTEVAVYFGEPGRRAPDPYFGGRGPDRVGCTLCGACMTGCRVGAKNTLDRNYLYLAERAGVEVRAETEVQAVRPRPGGGYVVEAGSTGGGSKQAWTARCVIFAGGVMGTIPLLLKLRDDPGALPKLSPRVGDMVRTNSEALIGILSPDREVDFTRGVAITSILHTDDQSHVEPTRYGRGSGFFRLLTLPHAPGGSVVARLGSAARALASSPGRWAGAFAARDFARQTQILVYMRTSEGRLGLRLGRSPWTGFKRGVVSRLEGDADAPAAYIPEATDIARRFADKVGGVPVGMMTEALLGVPSTAHILGGACMGEHAEEGVINRDHEVFGYEGLYVIDGSAVSANPGVNPSLTITALAERAMSRISPRSP